MILIERRTKANKLLGYNTEGILVSQECTKCSEYLPICEFSKHAGTVLGRNSRCVACESILRKEKHDKNPNYRKDSSKRDYVRNGEKIRARVNKYRLDNLESVNEKKAVWTKKVRQEQWWQDKHRVKRTKGCKAWRDVNQEHVKAYNKKYKEENYDFCIAISMERSNSIRRTQRSISKPFSKSILEFFKIIRELNKTFGLRSFSVDHIIPLKHPEVCGLHVPWNMRILPSSENCSKRNHFDGTYENESWRKRHE